MNRPDEDTLRRYLLGQLTAPEAEALEAAYFADGTLAAALEDAEDDLARAYLGGSLSGRDRGAFEQRLEQPGRAARLAFVHGVRAQAAAMPSAARAHWPMLAAAAVLLALAGWWLATTARAPDAPSRQADAPAPAPAEQVAHAPPAPPRVVVALVLPLTATRSGGGAPTAELPGDAAALALRVTAPLPPLPDLAAEVRAVDSEREWRGAVTPPGPDAPAATTGEVMVPAAALPAGDYVLTIRRADEAVARAFFRVVRR